MQSALSVPTASPRGAQEPRISWWPAYTTSAADEVLKVAKVAGIVLDPWQEFQLRHGLGESPDWKCPHCTHRAAGPVPCPAHPWADLIHPWAAFEVCSVVPRQNGKSELLVVRMLGGLFVLEEPLQIYSAHQFDTALEVMRRLVSVIKESDDLRREVKHRGSRLSGIVEANGKEGVELANGCRVRFKARTGGGGRGFSCDTLYLDEAMILPEIFLGATIPTLSARANPQIWEAGSAPDKQDPKHDGIVLAKRRRRALSGNDPSLAYFEHSAEGDDPATVPDAVLDSPKQWAHGNPGLGIRITPEYIANERLAMGARQFATERLGIGDWPDPDEDADRKIPREAWLACREAGLTVKPESIKPVCFAIHVNPERTWGAVGVAGKREDGKFVGAVIRHDTNPAGWIVDEAADLAKQHRPVALIWDKRGQANTFADDLAAKRVRNLKPVDTQELAEACARLFDVVTNRDESGRHAPQFAHIGQPALDAAVAGAGERTLGDKWAFQQRVSTADITPLVAVALALWGAAERKKKAGVINLAEALANAERAGQS
jgi:hypothetical protein